MGVGEYQEERVAELGEFLGTIIAGIYVGTLESESQNPSDFASTAGREHQSWQECFDSLRRQGI